MFKESASFALCADLRLHPYFLSKRTRLLARMALDRTESLPAILDLSPLKRKVLENWF